MKQSMTIIIEEVIDVKRKQSLDSKIMSIDKTKDLEQLKEKLYKSNMQVK